MADNKKEEILDDALVQQVAQALSKRSQRIVVAWLLGIVLAGGGAINFGLLESVARPDTSTGAELNKLDDRHTDDRRRIKSAVAGLRNDLAAHTIWAKEQLLEIKSKIRRAEENNPPGATRQRIEAVEHSVRRIDPQYKQPTYRWNDN